MFYESEGDLLHLNETQSPGTCQVIAIDKAQLTSLFDLMDIVGQVSPAAYPLSSAHVWGNVGSTPISTWIDENPHPLISPDFQIQILFEETEKVTTQLKAFTYKVLFDIPNDDFGTRGQIIQYFDKREWVLIVKQTSGAIRLIGSMDRSADFSTQLTAGSSLKGPSKFQCGFIWQTGPERAFYIYS